MHLISKQKNSPNPPETFISKIWYDEGDRNFLEKAIILRTHIGNTYNTIYTNEDYLIEIEFADVFLLAKYDRNRRKVLDK